MALREFVDRKGVRWKVWDVSADDVHQRLKDEKFYIGYDLGWLAFESADGRLRRRLCPCPPKWDEAPDEELERLCAEAEPVAARSKLADASDDPARATAEAEDVARLSAEVREREQEPPDPARRRPRSDDLRT